MKNPNQLPPRQFRLLSPLFRLSRIFRLAMLGALLPLMVLGLHAEEKTVKAYYELLTSADLESPLSLAQVQKQVDAIFSEDWESIPTLGSEEDGKNPRTHLGERIARFHDIIPNLRWRPLKIFKAKNQYTVVSQVSGTPVKPFFGVNPSGKSFDVLAIEIHTLVNGKISKSHHVEDWFQAINQLSE